MEPIVWKEGFSVGVSEMDSQHKKLIGMINMLIDNPKAKTDSVTVSDMLTEMIKYAQEHFRAEEALMAEHGYPLKDLQTEEHRAFVKKTVDFCTAAEVGVDILPQAMLEYLKNWLIHHILEQDMKYKPFFLERGLS